MNDSYDNLKIENQICFPLYACAKEVTRRYKPLLDKLDLTYTQYIVMMVMWEYKKMNVKELGEKVYLDSGTLTPLLLKLEAKGYISRTKDKDDARNLILEVTNKGLDLRRKATQVPQEMSKCVKLSLEEAQVLYKTLYKILDYFKEEGDN
jgi:DNA-binding MarR family transcriptional regulator